MSRSRFGLGFTTLEAETSGRPLPIRGALPAWLTGALVRTGPARFEVGGRSFNHWFDGLAMLHRFDFAGGRVSYANRYLHSHAHDDALASGAISYREFATDPCRTLFARALAVFFPAPFTDNGSVNIAQWHGQTVALTETRLPVCFDPVTLATLGVREYGSHLPGPISTAHPHYDRDRGLHYTYLLEFGPRSRYHLVSLDERTGREAIVATIPVDRPAYMHSFGMTERYLVVTEFPLVVNPLRLLFGGQPFIRNYRWRPERGLRMHVVEKDSGRVVRTARADACFAFHHVNAFEEADDIILDMVCRPDSTVIDQLFLDRLRADIPVDPTGRLVRFRIDAAAGVSQAALAEVSLELPRYDSRRLAGRRHRFVYGVGQHVPGNFLDCLVKVDCDEPHTRAWNEQGCYPGEPIFVAAPDAAAEDEGVVLSVVLDTRRGISFLLVLDAATFIERGRAEAPHHIPFGFHGDYLPASGRTP